MCIRDRDTGVILHLDEMAVPARGDQAEKRRGQIRMGQIVGGDMGTQMVDRDEWEEMCIRDRP